MAFHVTDQENWRQYAYYLDKMSMVRYRQFIDRPGQTEFYQKSPFQRDVDEYDTAGSSWFNVIDDAGNMLMGGRFTSWEYDTITGREFAHHSTEKLPDDDDVREENLWVDFSRIYYCPTIKGGQYTKKQAEIIYWWGIVQYMEQLRLKGYTGIIKHTMEGPVIHLPIILRSLGEPFLFNGQMHTIISATIRDDAYEFLSRRADIVGLDLDQFNIKRNCEGLEKKQSRFSPIIAHALNQYARDNIDVWNEISGLWDHYMSDNITLSNQASFEIEQIITKTTKTGLSGQLPNLHQDKGSIVIN